MASEGKGQSPRHPYLNASLCVNFSKHHMIVRHATYLLRHPSPTVHIYRLHPLHTLYLRRVEARLSENWRHADAQYVHAGTHDIKKNKNHRPNCQYRHETGLFPFGCMVDCHALTNHYNGSTNLV
jgi:hypothetical protein